MSLQDAIWMTCCVEKFSPDISSVVTKDPSQSLEFHRHESYAVVWSHQLVFDANQLLDQLGRVVLEQTKRIIQELLLP